MVTVFVSRLLKFPNTSVGATSDVHDAPTGYHLEVLGDASMKPLLVNDPLPDTRGRYVALRQCNSSRFNGGCISVPIPGRTYRVLHHDVDYLDHAIVSASVRPGCFWDVRDLI